MSSESKRLYICGVVSHRSVRSIRRGGNPNLLTCHKGRQMDELGIKLNDLLVFSTVADLILSRIGFFPLNALTF